MGTWVMITAIWYYMAIGEADSGKFGGEATFSQQSDALGLSASAGREGDGWRTAPAEIARSGSMMAEMFVDEDGDGARGADEAGVAGGRFIVGAALRREETDARGQVLMGAIAPGPDVDIEMQMSSLTDFTLHSARAGDRLALRLGEIRHVPIALRPTGSIEVQVQLVAGDQRTPRSGMVAVLHGSDGREGPRAVTDFDGYVFFQGLGFGPYRAEAAGQTSGALAVSREAPDAQTHLLVAAQVAG